MELMTGLEVAGAIMMAFILVSQEIWLPPLRYPCVEFPRIFGIWISNILRICPLLLEGDQGGCIPKGTPSQNMVPPSSSLIDDLLLCTWQLHHLFDYFVTSHFYTDGYIAKWILWWSSQLIVMKRIEDPEAEKRKPISQSRRVTTMSIWGATRLPSERTVSPGSTKQDKCIIRKRAKNFKLIDRVLHYQGKEEPWQVVTKIMTKRQILEACYDNRVGVCNFGCDKNFAKVSARFYWNGIKEDVNDWERRHDMHITVLCNACLAQ